jgi:hypothetical protein
VGNGGPGFPLLISHGSWQDCHSRIRAGRSSFRKSAWIDDEDRFKDLKRVITGLQRGRHPEKTYLRKWTQN